MDSFGVAEFASKGQVDQGTMCQYVEAGMGLVANVRGGAHWVLLTGCESGGAVYDVNDPDNFQAQYNYGDILEVVVYH